MTLVIAFDTASTSNSLFFFYRDAVKKDITLFASRNKYGFLKCLSCENDCNLFLDQWIIRTMRQEKSLEELFSGTILLSEWRDIMKSICWTLSKSYILYSLSDEYGNPHPPHLQSIARFAPIVYAVEIEKFISLHDKNRINEQCIIYTPGGKLHHCWSFRIIPAALNPAFRENDFLNQQDLISWIKFFCNFVLIAKIIISIWISWIEVCCWFSCFYE